MGIVADEGTRAPLILWLGLDCRGTLHQLSLRSVPAPANRIMTTAAYLWVEIDILLRNI